MYYMDTHSKIAGKLKGVSMMQQSVLLIDTIYFFSLIEEEVLFAFWKKEYLRKRQT